MQPEQVKTLLSGLHLTFNTTGELTVDLAVVDAQVERLLGQCWDVGRAGDGFICDLLVGCRDAFARRPVATGVMPAVLRLCWMSFVGLTPRDEERQAVYEQVRLVRDAKCGRALLASLTGDAVELRLAAGGLLNRRPFYEVNSSSYFENQETLRLEQLPRLTRWLEAAPGEEEAAFYQAMRDQPDDLARIAIYADWLDERGDVRAETVRAVFEVLSQATASDVNVARDTASGDAGPHQHGPNLPERLIDVSSGWDAWPHTLDPEEMARFRDLIQRQSERAVWRLTLLVAATLLATVCAVFALQSCGVCLIGLVIFAALMWSCLHHWPRRLWE